MELKTKYRNGAYLNNRQKKWFNNFQQQYPTSELREVHKGLSGDRLLEIGWVEPLPTILIPECEYCGAGLIHHRLIIKLRVFGDPREIIKYSYNISYRSCNLDLYEVVKSINSIAKNGSYFAGEGQLSLTVPQILEASIPQLPVIIKNKFSNRKKMKSGYNTKQLKLF